MAPKGKGGGGRGRGKSSYMASDKDFTPKSSPRDGKTPPRRPVVPRVQGHDIIKVTGSCSKDFCAVILRAGGATVLELTMSTDQVKQITRAPSQGKPGAWGPEMTFAGVPGLVMGASVAVELRLTSSKWEITINGQRRQDLDFVHIYPVEHVADVAVSNDNLKGFTSITLASDSSWGGAAAAEVAAAGTNATAAASADAKSAEDENKAAAAKQVEEEKQTAAAVAAAKKAEDEKKQAAAAVAAAKKAEEEKQAVSAAAAKKAKEEKAVATADAAKKVEGEAQAVASEKAVDAENTDGLELLQAQGANRAFNCFARCTIS